MEQVAQVGEILGKPAEIRVIFGPLSGNPEAEGTLCPEAEFMDLKLCGHRCPCWLFLLEQ